MSNVSDISLLMIINSGRNYKQPLYTSHLERLTSSIRYTVAQRVCLNKIAKSGYCFFVYTPLSFMYFA